MTPSLRKVMMRGRVIFCLPKFPARIFKVTCECNIKGKRNKRYGKSKYRAVCYQGMTVVFVVAGQNIVTVRTSYD